MADTTAVESYLDLSPAGKQLLKNGLASKRFARPTPVIHKGQRVSGAYLVTRGQLRVFTFTPQGTEATLYFIRPGETCVLALNCLFNDLLYPAWVEASADTDVALIPGPLYRSLFEREAGVQDMTVKALSTLVFRLMGELEQIHSCNLDQRLANFLLSNADAAGTLHMTQQELAGHLGTTREVVARLMQGFVAHGLVATGRGAVNVKDSERLAELVRHGKD
ncbi:MAG: Crp/Fnr family transcriptional regulator [Rhodocyclales bacterium]|nr:Crp/Fnr family transcriptional regulator [Rhodocyclales bacterium]